MYIKGRLIERVAGLNKRTLKRPSLHYLPQYIILMNDNSDQ